MLNEAHYEQDWVAQRLTPERPHMETNRWLNAVRTTRSAQPRPVPETETFELLGLKLVWTKDGARPFPAPILNAIKSMIDFAELPLNWNSYGGKPLAAAAAAPAMQLVVRGHRTADFPRLHPLPDGGVSLTWNRDDNELEIAVSANGEVEGLLSLDEDEFELLPGASLEAGMELLERYLTAR